VSYMTIEIVNERHIRINNRVFIGERAEGFLEVIVPVDMLSGLRFADIPPAVRLITDVAQLLPKSTARIVTETLSCSTDIQVTREGILYVYDLIPRYYRGVASLDTFFAVTVKLASMLGFKILDQVEEQHYVSAELFFPVSEEDHIISTIKRTVIRLLELLSRLNSFLELRIQKLIDEFFRAYFQ